VLLASFAVAANAVSVLLVVFEVFALFGFPAPSTLSLPLSHSSLFFSKPVMT
jgi:hypothetical protein